MRRSRRPPNDRRDAAACDAHESARALPAHSTTPWPNRCVPWCNHAKSGLPWLGKYRRGTPRRRTGLSRTASASSARHQGGHQVFLKRTRTGSRRFNASAYALNFTPDSPAPAAAHLLFAAWNQMKIIIARQESCASKETLRSDRSRLEPNLVIVVAAFLRLRLQRYRTTKRPGAALARNETLRRSRDVRRQRAWQSRHHVSAVRSDTHRRHRKPRPESHPIQTPA